jgi:hypothetical protein
LHTHSRSFRKGCCGLPLASTIGSIAICAGSSHDRSGQCGNWRKMIS